MYNYLEIDKIPIKVKLNRRQFQTEQYAIIAKFNTNVKTLGKISKIIYVYHVRNNTRCKEK